MSALDTLLKRCNDMDITEQLNIFDDAFLPSNAAAELAALREQLAEEEARNKLFSDCLHRGLQMWKQAHPEEEMWISGEKNIVWLLEQVRAKDALQEFADEMRKVLASEGWELPSEGGRNFALAASLKVLDEELHVLKGGEHA